MRFEDAYEGWTEQRLTQIDAARLLGVCPRTFRRNINRYEEDGLDGRIETLLLQVLEAAYSSGRDKTRALQRALRQMNVVRHLWHLSHELKAVSSRRPLFAAAPGTIIRGICVPRTATGSGRRLASVSAFGLSRRPGFRSGRVHGRGQRDGGIHEPVSRPSSDARANSEARRRPRGG